MKIKEYLILFLLFLSITVFAETDIVSRVIDGDTIVLKSGTRVRLYGIDAPEYNQPYGPQAKKWLKNLLLNKEIRFEKIFIGCYRRKICKIYLQNIYVNKFIVSSGYAWWYKRYASKDKDLAKAEIHARKNKLGLWSAPVYPEKFRRSKKKIQYQK